MLFAFATSASITIAHWVLTHNRCHHFCSKNPASPSPSYCSAHSGNKRLLVHSSFCCYLATASFSSIAVVSAQESIQYTAPLSVAAASQSSFALLTVSIEDESVGFDIAFD